MKRTLGAAGVWFAVVWAALAPASSRQGGQAPASPRAQEEDARGVLAILRRDGVILPFAAFNNNSWSTPWPAGLRFKELPVNASAVPDQWWGGRKPDTWRAWLADGTNRSIEVQTPTVFNTHCDRRLGLRTDYRPSEPLPPVAVLPFPKDGLAVAGGVSVEPIESMNRSSSEWSTLAVALMDDFDRAENREISAAAATSRWKHPVRAATRKSIPVRIESYYRTPVDDTGATVSWIEAVRSYPPGPDDQDCGLETLFSGWVYREKPEVRPRADIAARLMYCDRVGAAYMLPLGKIQVRRSVYWIYQLSGYDSEWYAVAELSRSRVKFVAEYFAGGCR
jgi:hypothetical protein